MLIINYDKSTRRFSALIKATDASELYRKALRRPYSGSHANSKVIELKKKAANETNPENKKGLITRARKWMALANGTFNSMKFDSSI